MEPIFAFHWTFYLANGRFHGPLGPLQPQDREESPYPVKSAMQSHSKCPNDLLGKLLLDEVRLLNQVSVNENIWSITVFWHTDTCALIY